MKTQNLFTSSKNLTFILLLFGFHTLVASNFPAIGTVSLYSVPPTNNSTAAYEGCIGYFKFVRNGDSDINEPQVVDYTLTGTAINGVDYIAIPNSQITIPAGQSTYLLPIEPIMDGQFEGEETITLELNSLCSISNHTTSLTIIDATPLQAEATDQKVCELDETEIFVTAQGGITPYIYEWNTGETTDIITVSSDNATYRVTVTDACGFQVVETIKVTEMPQPHFHVFGSRDGNSCMQSNSQITIGGTNGIAPFYYNWENGSSGPTIKGLTAGSISVTITDGNGCVNDTTFTMNRLAIKGYKRL